MKGSVSKTVMLLLCAFIFCNTHFYVFSIGYHWENMNIEYTFNQSLHTIQTSVMGFTGIRPTLGSTLHNPHPSLTLEFFWNLTELISNFIISKDKKLV
jgi:hypothetical protein